MGVEFKGRDLTGLMFGRLQVMKFSHRNKSGVLMWECVCSCPDRPTRIVASSNLTTGNSTSCGCAHKEMLSKTSLGRNGNKRLEMIGKTFSRLKVLSVDRVEGGHSYYKCKCDCGNHCVVLGTHLTRGSTTSCGCRALEVQKTHGLSKHRLYRIWKNMRQRCLNSNLPRYEDYGGRGISICDEWLDDFKSFYDWAMSNGYRDDLSIDRIDNERGYEPGNCRWATDAEQTQNTRRNVILSMLMADAIRRDPRSGSEIARDLNISVSAVNKVRSGKAWRKNDHE